MYLCLLKTYRSDCRYSLLTAVLQANICLIALGKCLIHKIPTKRNDNKYNYNMYSYIVLCICYQPELLMHW